MGSNPLMKSALIGVVMQGLMVVIGKYVPALGSMPNIYAICGTALAAVTGAIFAKGSVGASAGSVATGGAIVGGGTSAIGGLLAVATGQWPGFEALQILFPIISGAVGGSVGGIVARMTSKPSAA